MTPRENRSRVATACATPGLRSKLVAAALRAGAVTRTEAEDCVQDALVSALATKTSVEDEARTDAWLVRIVVNATRMRRRARKRARRGAGCEHVELDEALVGAGVARDPEVMAIELETLLRVEHALRAEPDRDLLHAWVETPGSIRALADANGQSVAFVKTRIYRLRQRLRTAVEQPLRRAS